MKKLEVRFTRSPGDWLPVGTLAEDRGRVYFEYAAGVPDHRPEPLALSPAVRARPVRAHRPRLRAAAG